MCKIETVRGCRTADGARRTYRVRGLTPGLDLFGRAIGAIPPTVGLDLTLHGVEARCDEDSVLVEASYSRGGPVATAAVDPGQDIRTAEERSLYGRSRH